MIVLALLSTLGLNVYTLAQIVRARTSVPWADQWAMLLDLARHEHGESLWSIVWPPYWGHRLVIPRLLFFADGRWLSLKSLTWLTMVLQFVHVALLIALAWLLLKRKPAVLFLIAATVILNLMFSPFQMENFVWGMQTMFPLVFLAATGAFLCLPQGSRGFPWAIALGLISAFTMPNGILIWPVLVLQSLYLKQSRKVTAALAMVGSVVIVSYLWHYERPLELGMGVVGMLRHPIDAILLLGLIVGAPFRLPIFAGAIVGTAALVITGYVFIRALLSRIEDRKWFSALFAIIVFLLLSSLSIVAGRLSPVDLHRPGRDFLPGRHFTMICLIWTVIALLALATSQRQTWVLAIYGILFAGLMFGDLTVQLTEAEDWADFFLATDAVGSAFLLDAPDEQLLSVLWLSKPERDERVQFMRGHRLAVFHEPRATWPGKRVSELFSPSPDRCEGAIEKMVDLDGSSWRVTGWAWDTSASRPPDDILLTDADGRITGLARGGLRHGYFPVFLVEPQPQPAHSRFRHSEWLGYVRKTAGTSWEDVRLYGLFRRERKVCAIQ